MVITLSGRNGVIVTWSVDKEIKPDTELAQTQVLHMEEEHVWNKILVLKKKWISVQKIHAQVCAYLSLQVIIESEVILDHNFRELSMECL